MIIFDLDGTLADCKHRRHFVQEPKKWEFRRQIVNGIPSETTIEKHETEDWKKWKPDYDSFYGACDRDTPILPVINIWNQEEVSISLDRCDYHIWSGRSESVRKKTIDWLEKHLFFAKDTWFDEILKMRPIGDSTPDDILKERWLDEALAQGKTIDYVFDDRTKVVRMWRRRDIFVFNCNQSDEEF